MRQDRYKFQGSQQQLSHQDWSYDTLIQSDFRSADLSHGNFSYADFRAANLQGANLRGAILHYTCFLRADLRGADLQDAHILDCRWQGAIYDSKTQFPPEFNYRSVGMLGPKAQLNGAQLNTANLRGLDLSESSLLGAYLGGADLTGAKLEVVRLSQADLRCAFLTGASLRNSRLQGANLAGADLRATDWTGVELDSLESIAGADFTMAVGLSESVAGIIFADARYRRNTSPYPLFNPPLFGDILDLL